MSKNKPNFNTDDFFSLFTSYSELYLYATILRVSSYDDKFVHNQKSRIALTTILGVSEIQIKVLLRKLVDNKVFNKGRRGIYHYKKELLQ